MKLVAIGYQGGQTVYIDHTKEEAMSRFDRENPESKISEKRYSVKEFEVTDRFYVYDIWDYEDEGV